MVCRMTWSKVKVKVMSVWKPHKTSRPSVPHGINFWQQGAWHEWGDGRTVIYDCLVVFCDSRCGSSDAAMRTLFIVFVLCRAILRATKSLMQFYAPLSHQILATPLTLCIVSTGVIDPCGRYMLRSTDTVEFTCCQELEPNSENAVSVTPVQLPETVFLGFWPTWHYWHYVHRTPTCVFFDRVHCTTLLDVAFGGALQIWRWNWNWNRRVYNIAKFYRYSQGGATIRCYRHKTLLSSMSAVQSSAKRRVLRYRSWLVESYIAELSFLHYLTDQINVISLTERFKFAGI